MEPRSIGTENEAGQQGWMCSQDSGETEEATHRATQIQGAGQHDTRQVSLDTCAELPLVTRRKKFLPDIFFPKLGMFLLCFTLNIKVMPDCYKNR